MRRVSNNATYRLSINCHTIQSRMIPTQFVTKGRMVRQLLHCPCNSLQRRVNGEETSFTYHRNPGAFKALSDISLIGIVISARKFVRLGLLDRVASGQLLCSEIVDEHIRAVSLHIVSVHRSIAFLQLSSNASVCCIWVPHLSLRNSIRL
jgi:hypothetical protein